MNILPTHQMSTHQANDTLVWIKWHLPVELDHLTEAEQEVVRQMLFEESDVFTKEEGDIGCIPDLQLKINMVDDHPIQKCYNSIPKPLYQEVKVCTKSFEPRVDQEISVGSFLLHSLCAPKRPKIATLCVLLWSD